MWAEPKRITAHHARWLSFRLLSEIGRRFPASFLISFYPFNVSVV